MPAVEVSDAGVMAGHERITAKANGLIEQGGELDRPVALDAGIGGATAPVIIDKAVDDPRPEVVRVVEHVVGDVELGGNPPGVFGVADRAATGGGSLARRTRPHLEGDPDDLMAFRLHQRRGHRRVDPARHRDEDPHTVTLSTWLSIASMTRSAASPASATVEVHPNENRSERLACSRLRPIADSTWETVVAPE